MFREQNEVKTALGQLINDNNLKEMQLDRGKIAIFAN